MKHLSFLILVLMSLLLSSCHIGRFFYFNYANADDYKKFPQVPINKSGEEFHFYESAISSTINSQLPDTFNTFLANTKTISFLVIRNDSIKYEYYDEDFDTSSVFTSFSVAKSVVSALVGISIDEGLIANVNVPIIQLIPELDKSLAPITFEHLLNMRSGIDYEEGYNSPYADMAKYYYGLNLSKYITKLEVIEAPNLHYNYQSVNTLLLSIAVERAAGMSLNKYLEQKLWKPMGMEYSASWNIDSEKSNTIKGFCCLNARARDFAKFGRLYLNKGKWGDTILISPEWIAKTLTVTNDSRDSRGYPYSYQWRVLPSGQFFARGILGQYIYCDPTKNLVIVRLGETEAEIDWIKVFQKLPL